MKAKTAAIAFTLILLIFSSLVSAASYELKETTTKKFKGYFCLRSGGSDMQATAKGLFWVDIDVGGCLSELYVCWLEGWCGIKIIKDVWGITSVGVNPKTVLLDDIVEGTISVKNFTDKTVSGTLTYFLKNLVTGEIVFTDTKNITNLSPGSVDTTTPSFNITSTEFQEKIGYQLVARLSAPTAPAELVGSDDPGNNRGTDDFTVLRPEEEIAVPEISPVFAPVIALIVLVILLLDSRKKKK